MNHPTRLVLTMGDPAGIGPEIIAKAVRQLNPAVLSGELKRQQDQFQQRSLPVFFY